MTFPFDVLVHGGREFGLVVAVAIGFGFGFVLERSGFGRAQKLVAQFFGDDMTVFKVMFGAIVTAMLGAVVLSGLGLADLKAIADSATSATWLWPMIAGGFLLGVGFIVSGYCPGTSVVAAASGKLDGLAAVVGVVAGTVVYGELMAWAPFAAFTDSGYLGHVYLYELLHLPAAVVALFVAAMAVACFVGAEKLEAIFSKGTASSPSRAVSDSRSRRLVFAGFGAAALAGVATLALPSATSAVAAPARIDPEALAHRVVEAPWNVRVLDLRAADACGQARVPGAECAPAAILEGLDLGFAPASRDLVLVADGDLAELPAAARAYKGRVLVLEGGWEAWKTWALDREDAVQSMPPPGAPAADVAAYRFRNAVNAALTGVKVAPPPAPAAGGGMPAPKRKASGGGCSG